MQDIKSEVVVKQCIPGWRQLKRARLITAHGWAKVDPQLVVSLLQNASFEARQPAQRLLWAMQRQPWFLRAKTDVESFAHTAIAIKVGGRNWQLHCHEGVNLRHIEAVA